ncbi:MAG TPA: 3-hydroxyacyl-CoA dehydrogenase family protein [Planctomycetota bacterium]|nr:3-hydroxyacyl-CoA dehydrogenase family protein [Planctomycetota bacterium]
MEVRTILVVGAGTMGHGIAQVAAQAGYGVRLYDVDEKAVAAGLARIRGNLDKGVEKGKVLAADRDAALARVTTTTNLRSAAEGVDLVVEAAPERLDLKRRIFGEVSATAPAHAVLASNTSSLSIARIAAATDRPTRVVGMHFFNPVHLKPLLEIVRAEGTSAEALEAAVGVGKRMGKTVVVVKDSPGFATSRLGIALGLEAMRMVEEGVASPADIDTAMEKGYGHAMGPLRTTDLVGLDVRLEIARYLDTCFPGGRFTPPALLERMVAEGRLGQKAGRGFYDWTPSA